MRHYTMDYRPCQAQNRRLPRIAIESGFTIATGDVAGGRHLWLSDKLPCDALYILFATGDVAGGRHLWLSSQLGRTKASSSSSKAELVVGCQKEPWPVANSI